MDNEETITKKHLQFHTLPFCGSSVNFNFSKSGELFRNIK